jgi:hypothetical protein
MFTRRRTWLLVVVLLGALPLGVLLILVLAPGPAPAPVPIPNGYDDFLNAAAATSGNIGDYPTLEHDALRDLISTNAESLHVLRLGLTRQCAVPPDIDVTNLLTDLASMKRLAQLLAAEGRLRELDHQPADATRAYLDAIHFGNESSRGGVMICRLVGIACEAIGRAPLAKLAPNLTPEQARKVSAELEAIDRTRVTWDEVQRSEKRFARHEMRKHPNPLVWPILWWQLMESIKRASEKHFRIIAQERLLAAELALRCYQADKARPPARLEALVPDYLSKVPQDPFTNQPLIYRPQGTNWLLYSIGPDGVDNGGKPAARGQPSVGDLLYNAP